MPVSSVTEHWIKPDAVTINLNHFGDPDYLQVSVLAGAVVMAFKQDVIAYNAAHNYRTWPLQAANTYLENTSAVNVYARLTRSEVNASALIVYDPVLRDIEGSPISYTDDGSEVLGEPDSIYFYIFLGQISESVDNNGNKKDREWLKIIQYGSLDSSEQKNNFGSLWEKLFKPHYEDPTDPEKLSWIEAKANMGIQGGVSMFIKGDNVYIPTIAEGLPFDGRTIWFNPTTNQIEVIGGIGGGVADSVAWQDVVGKPSWLLDDKISYSEIEGTPDLSVYALKSAIPSLDGYAKLTDIPSLNGYATEQWVIGKGYALNSDLTALSNKVTDFLEGSDTDNIINKWKELESFLNGLSESDNLATILGTKADKSYVDSTFVTINGTEDVTGLHDFTNGLKIGGMKLFKSQDDVVYLDGNLVVRGGVTMYAVDKVTIDSIIDSLPTASTSVKGIASFDSAFFTVDGNGKVSLIESNVGLNEDELSAYLENHKYATQEWVSQQKYLTGISSQMVVSALGFTPYDSASFTKANIKSTLGISDWALAASKPSYKTSEVTEDGNLYFTDARAVNALSATIRALQDDIATKWTQDDTKIANWDAAYKWGDHSKVGYALKSYVDDELTKYVTLSGSQTITGAKDFTGGLKVNGSPIYYDKDKKYWKLEGDLIVTGGVSMYSNDSSYTPSTIMDALVYDSSTLGINSQGQLYVKGGAGGAITSIDYSMVVSALGFTPYDAANPNGYITSSAIPTSLKNPYSLTFGSKTYDGSAAKTITASDLGALTAHQSIYALTIKNSGGTTQLTYTPNSAAGSLTLTKSMVGLGNVENTALSTWVGTNKITTLGTITTGTWNGTKIANTYLANSAITISGTSVSLGGSITQSALRTALGLGSNAYSSTAFLPLTGGILTGALRINTDSANCLYLQNTQATSTSRYAAIRFVVGGTHIAGIGVSTSGGVLQRINSDFSGNYTVWDSGNDGSGSGLDADLLDGKHLSDILASNVASATKLQTARTIWGQSFDGSEDVSGNLFIPNGNALQFKNSSSANVNSLYFDSSNILHLGYGTSGSYNTKIYGNNLYLHYGSRSTGMVLNNSGNVTIGSSDLASTNYKLYVNGVSYFSSQMNVVGNFYKYNAAKTYRLSFVNDSDYCRIYNIKADGSAYGKLSFSGNVGINITNPSADLHVSGDILATGGVTTNDSMTINGIKISKSQDGVLYLDGNLVVKGGVTMYGSDSTSAPSLIDSLPIASTSVKGIAQFSSAHFTVTDGIVSIIGSNVGLNQTELEIYLTTNKYAKKSDIPTIPTSLKNPYSLTFGSKTYDGSAAKTITASDLGALTAHQTIYNLTIKNSAGTTQLTYDPNGEAGSITLTKAMVGLGNVENTALSSWTGTNKITTLGTITSGTWNGTKIANTYLANSAITISGTSVSLGGSITQSALRTALGLGSNAYSSTAYLPSANYTASDVLSKLLTVDGSGSGLDADMLDGKHADSFMNFAATSTYVGASMGNENLSKLASGDGYIEFWDSAGGWFNSKWGTVTANSGFVGSLSGNASSATKLQTARTIWGQSFDGTGNVSGNFTGGALFYNAHGHEFLNSGIYGSNLAIGFGTAAEKINTEILGYNIYFKYGTSRTTGITLDSSGVVSLANHMILSNNKNVYFYNTSGTAINVLNFSTSNNLHIGSGAATTGYSTYIDGATVRMRYGTSTAVGFVLNSSGNITIGSSDLASTNYKLYVNGAGYIKGSFASWGNTTKYNAAGTYRLMTVHNSDYCTLYNIKDDGSGYGSIGLGKPDGSALFVKSDGNVGIGTTSPSYKLHVAGNILATGGVTMYSARKLKTIKDERGLSLEELKIIKPTRFTWKDGRDDKVHIGGIADDVIKVLPEVIYKTGDDDTLTMDYGNAAFAIAASLIKPVVNHEERIKVLEEENKRLKEQIERLKLR